jgi:hypothetical protein
MTDRPLPPAAVLITQPVTDFDAWKAGFDAGEPMRRAAGVLGHHVNRAEDDPNSVTVYLAVSDLDTAKAFMGSDDLEEKMKASGVTASPELVWVTPVREAIVWDRELPAMMIQHTVADFDRWLEGYDAAGEIQTSKGIIGHAANRSIDDPSLALIYHQAESFDTLRAFLADPQLREAMGAAGVTSEPEVTFHTGGWAKSYA